MYNYMLDVAAFNAKRYPEKAEIVGMKLQAFYSCQDKTNQKILAKDAADALFDLIYASLSGEEQISDRSEIVQEQKEI